MPIVAARTPSHCFEATIEAVRIAVKYRTPVLLLSDGYLANGTEPWRLPDLDDLPAIDPGFATGPNHVEEDGTVDFWPYLRDDETLARPWAPPGLAGLEHRIGGLEKSDGARTLMVPVVQRADEAEFRGFWKAYEDLGRFGEAIELCTTMSLADDLDEFLTLPAYKLLG